jgi:DNA-binding transcriptional ArsR family regulator
LYAKNLQKAQSHITSIRAILPRPLVGVQYIKGRLYIMLHTMDERKSICAGSHDDSTLALAAQEHLLDGVTATRAAELFGALSDPTRVRIVGLLAHMELCVGDLCLVLGMSQPAVSHHLRLLRTLRIVEARKEGKHVFYSLLDDHIHQLFHQGVDHIQQG